MHRDPLRRPIASLNYLLSSHVWRQDHSGFTHQDPGFLDVVVNKKSEVVRVYLPPDANILLSTHDHCLRSRQYANVVVAGKQPALDDLTMDEAVLHCTRGIGIWEWASNDDSHALPDVVMACAGDIPTLETLAAVAILREQLPELRVAWSTSSTSCVQPESEHPHGMPDREFDALFTEDRPVVFAFHGYPWLVHRLTYRRTNHANLHVRGFKEEGTTTTPFDMVMMNDLDRYSPASWTSSTACPASAPAPRTCASRWSTAGCGRACTPASTVKTCPRSPAGPGPAEPRSGPPPGRRLGGGPLAQLVEQGTFNPRVVGSRPTRPTGTVGGRWDRRPREPTKRCCTCHEPRPLTDFNVRRAAADGLQSRCRSCSREWYLTAPGAAPGQRPSPHGGHAHRVQAPDR